MPPATTRSGKRIPPDRAKAILENYAIPLMRRAGMTVVVKRRSDNVYKLTVTLPDRLEITDGKP